MRCVIVFLFVCFYFPNIAFAKYCTEGFFVNSTNEVSDGYNIFK